MAEKKTPDTQAMETTPDPEKHTKNLNNEKNADKSAPVTVIVPPTSNASVTTVPSFTKTPPNDLYRRLLPAVLFLLTFVTVMTMLLIYMDTVALGAQQFRMNMSRDYELPGIAQDSPALVALVRQLHLKARPALDGPARPTRGVTALNTVFGSDYAGSLVEISSGPVSGTALALRGAGWRGLVVRAAPRDYLAVRGLHALHAGLSGSHPREVAYVEEESGGAGSFSSRVLCLPLYSILLAGDATNADYVMLSGENVLPALQILPFEKVHLKVIEVRTTDQELKSKTTELLKTKGYKVLAEFEDSVMHVLEEPDLENTTDSAKE